MNNMTEEMETITDETGGIPETGNQVSVTSRQGKKKRLLAKRVTSIYISDVSIKITVACGHEIEKWVNAPLEPGLVVNGIVTDVNGMGAKLADLVKKHEINKNSVIIGLSGLNSITRIFTLPNVPKKFMEEAISHEAERELPVPTDTVYLSWQIIEKTADDMKVFLIAYAKNAIDPLMSALKKADIKPYFMELAPLALARSVNRSTSVIFDVRPGEMDIVVMIDNIPELSRSVPLPLESSAEANLPIILEELHRTISYYQSENSIDSLPVFGFGDLYSQLCESLSQVLSNPIAISYPPLYYAPEFLPDNYSVNIGLALERIKLLDPGYQRRVSVNILPEKYLPAKLAPRLLVPAGATASAAILLAVLLMWQSASADTDSVRSDLETARQELVQAQAEKTSLQTEADALTAEADQKAEEFSALSLSFDTIAAQQVIIDDDLDLLRAALEAPKSSDVSFSSISHDGNNYVIIKGAASTKQQILNYTSNLEDSGRFSDVVLTIHDPGVVEGVPVPPYFVLELTA